MPIIIGCVIGFIAWFLVRYLVAGLFTVNQNERAVKTSFGRAQRISNLTTLDDPVSEFLNSDEKTRYAYPQVRVIMPGGPYFKWPWEKVHKVSIATETMNMARDPEDPSANTSGRVHFRDIGMIKQIESKVVNRLRQVTSAIKQDGANQVSIITSTAERQAAIEFAKAAAIRPEIVGATLQTISQDSEMASAMFEILEAQKIIEGEARITLLPEGGGLLAPLLAAGTVNEPSASPP